MGAAIFYPWDLIVLKEGVREDTMLAFSMKEDVLS